MICDVFGQLECILHNRYLIWVYFPCRTAAVQGSKTRVLTEGMDAGKAMMESIKKAKFDKGADGKSRGTMCAGGKAASANFL